MLPMERRQRPIENVFNSCNDLAAGACWGNALESPDAYRPGHFFRHLAPAKTQEPPTARKNAAAAFHAQAAQEGPTLAVEAASGEARSAGGVLR
jgi:hypothetical protein